MQAYNAFAALGSFSDAAAMAQKCRQPMPSNGAFKRDGGSSVDLKIIAPSGARSVYVKIYTSGGSLASTVFISPGGSARVSLSSGSHRINVAYGSEWWGEKDLFGPNGLYSQLLNGGSNTFTFESNGSYELTLIVSSGGNVGSQSIGRNNF
jgi:hypothetical protein